MRWIRFSTAGKTAYGVLENQQIAEVAGDPFNGYERTAIVHPLEAVKIEVPVIPRTFYCAGKNYVGHIKGVSAAGVYSPDIPTEPYVAYRGSNAVVAHGEPVVIPRDATSAVHYEGELVAVIGKKAKHLSERDALGCVLGYTIGNDVSERSWQRSDTTNWRAKNTDTFNPLGPWIETDVDFDAMETVVRVDGVERTRFKTGDMLFGVASFISSITRYITLYPGDVISMGTDGVSPDIKPGNIVEIEITGIGTLSNPFIAED